MLSINAEQTFATEEEKLCYVIDLTGSIFGLSGVDAAKLILDYKQMQHLRDTLSTLIQQKPEIYKATLK